MPLITSINYYISTMSHIIYMSINSDKKVSGVLAA